MTSISNSELTKFKNILETYNGGFFATLKRYGNLLAELEKDKITENVTINNIDPTATTHNTEDLSKFIRKIINFDIGDLSDMPEATTPAAINLRFIKKVTTGQTAAYSFDDFNKKNIIETLKVLNVFVDILEAYKYCIDTEAGIPGITTIKSGFSNDIVIDRIELVSNTTRIYNTVGSTTTMYPEKQFKNIGYIRKIKESTDGDSITVLYLSIETFYTGMTNVNYNYNNMFDKDSVNSTSTSTDIIITNILGSGSINNGNTPTPLSKKDYARQKIIRTENISNINLTLNDRNKNLIKSLLKMLLNINSYKKQTVYALYYYYKFVKLYSIFVINLSNVMYSDQGQGTVKRIETVNMAVPNMYYNMSLEDANSYIGRGISGLEIDNGTGKSEGLGYRTTGTKSNPIKFTETTTGFSIINDIPGVAAITSRAQGQIALDAPVTISERGDMYISDPSAIFADDAGTGNYLLVDAILVAATTTGQAGATETKAAQMTGTNAITLKTTIVPIALSDSDTAQDTNIKYLSKTVNNIYDSINASMVDMINSFDDRKDVDTITLSNNSSSDVPKVKLLDNKKVALKIRKSSDVTDIKYIIDKNNIIDYIIFDNRNKNFYTIEKIDVVSASPNLLIYIDAVMNPNDISLSDDKFKNTNVFVKEINELIVKTSATEYDFCDVSVTDPHRINFLQFRKKDLNIYKEEYTKEKREIQLLDIKINKNSMDIEHQKNLYDTEYNKNLFLNRQIISYNTIIAFIILVLVVINIIYVDKLFVKVVSLVCLAVVLLLFVVYFISSITYIESFASPPAINAADPTFGDLFASSKTTTTATSTATAYITEKKIPCLKRLIKTMNFKFISYFEKITITIPSIDSITFYKDIKSYIGKDIDIKNYSHKISEFNINDTVNNVDLLKYEIENNKLYLMSLLIATIIFLSIYNMYINYVSNDKFLSLTVFICVIILIIIGSYYIIRSNRRVRSYHKNIYWGPETYYRF